MKKNEFKLISKEEASKQLQDLRLELMKLNAQVATGTVPKSPGRMHVIKKTIAKLMLKVEQGGGIEKR